MENFTSQNIFLWHFFFSLLPPKMIAPITGKLRNQFFKDLTISLVLGAAGGAAWWNLYHIPNVQRRDAYYAKLEASK
jgi:cytochrome c oxidase subunit 7